MGALEFHRVGEPADAVAERADRQLDQHLLVAAVVIMGETPDDRRRTPRSGRACNSAWRCAPSPSGSSFHRGHCRCRDRKAGCAKALRFRHRDAGAEVEVEAQSVRAELGWQLGGRREMRLLRRVRCGRGGARRRSGGRDQRYRTLGQPGSFARARRRLGSLVRLEPSQTNLTNEPP